MKASYQTVQELLDAGYPICEYNNCGHRWMAIGARILTEKAELMVWRHEYLVDVMGTELDTAIGRANLVHVWVRGH